MLRSVLNHLILVVIALCSVVSSSAADSREELSAAVRQEAINGNYRLIDVEELWKLYQADSKTILLIDTRQEWEFRTGHIDGAVHFSMEPTWFERLIQRHALSQALGPDKQRPLVFY